jgi:signal transduction histidine kinase
MRPTGRTLLSQARDRYEAWGAMGKVRQMERNHAFLRVRMSSESAAQPEGQFAAGSDAIDLLAVLRASQSLSSETSVQQLRLRVAELLGALTGAGHVTLALWHEDTGKWMLTGTGAGGGEESIPVDEAAAGLLPLTAFRYAERTREVLLVEDARRDDRFRDDPYVAPLECCSLLVVPIASQGVMRAMLLLENRLSAAAFSAERLDAVRLIAGQLAVSLENALLYQELERRVQDRTRELRAAQVELVDTARRAGMAEIASNVLHNVGNVLNSVNVSANLVSSRLRKSKVRGLDRAVELMKAHAGDIGDFMAADDKGKLLPGYLENLADAVRAEQHDIVEELANLTRSVEHIKDVVATQQAHAGSSSVIEPADLGELAADALRINAILLERMGVQVERVVEDVPRLELDRTRVVQILVNLIRNGIQAMEGATGARHLRLQVRRDGDSVQVRVTDAGVGIPAENLTRIFAHGFTTRRHGHGFGLHSSALAAREMGGGLSASSEGPGRGATFVLELPLLAAPAF